MIVVTREAIIACARTWVDTPFDHQAQRKGVGCDCKGLIVGVGLELDLPEARTLAAGIRDYSPTFQGRRLLAGLKDSLVRAAQPLPGDVAAILMGRDPCPRHLAILTGEETIIHTYGGGVGRVVEVPLGHWRVHSYWSWPSLEACNG